MTIGAQGSAGGQTSSTNQLTTTPMTPIFNQLAGAGGPLTTGLTTLASGAGITQGMQNITNYSNQNLETGIQGMKSAFAGSGMGQSTALASGINQLTQQSETGLQASLSQFQMQGLTNQLGALGEIIALAQGSSAVSQNTNTFGWNAGGGFSI